MAQAKVSLEVGTIQSQVKIAVGEMLADAEQVRLVAESVEALVTEVVADAATSELRKAAAVVRTHTLGMLHHAVRLATRAERLETIADVREMAGPQDNDISN